MGDAVGGHGEGLTSLTGALNRDALEEVFLHCDPTDLLALRATCQSAVRLLDSSEKVWLAKLREKFGLHLKVRCLVLRLGRLPASSLPLEGMQKDINSVARPSRVEAPSCRHSVLQGCLPQTLPDQPNRRPWAPPATASSCSWLVACLKPPLRSSCDFRACLSTAGWMRLAGQAE
jgi:hypothetical protein